MLETAEGSFWAIVSEVTVGWDEDVDFWFFQAREAGLCNLFGFNESLAWVVYDLGKSD